jgi:hypothetical protein
VFTLIRGELKVHQRRFLGSHGSLQRPWWQRQQPLNHHVKPSQQWTKGEEKRRRRKGKRRKGINIIMRKQTWKWKWKKKKKKKKKKSKSRKRYNERDGTTKWAARESSVDRQEVMLVMGIIFKC